MGVKSLQHKQQFTNVAWLQAKEPSLLLCNKEAEKRQWKRPFVCHTSRNIFYFTYLTRYSLEIESLSSKGELAKKAVTQLVILKGVRVSFTLHTVGVSGERRTVYISILSALHLFIPLPETFW